MIWAWVLVAYSAGATLLVMVLTACLSRLTDDIGRALQPDYSDEPPAPHRCQYDSAAGRVRFPDSTIIRCSVPRCTAWLAVKEK